MTDILEFMGLLLLAGAFIRCGFELTGGLMPWRRAVKLHGGLVRIVSRGGLVRGTEIRTACGAKIHGVRSCFIDMDASGETVVASLEIVSAGVKVDAEPVFRVADPCTGKIKRVARIEFEGGEVFDAEAFTR